MRVLVTGATGMLGTSVMRHFLGHGHEVHGLSRGNRMRAPFEGEHRVQSDITDKKEMDRLMKSIRPNVVIHTAALSDVDFCEENSKEAHRVNGEGTRILAEASEREGAHFCYISTDYVFDGEKRDPYREEDPCRPVNAYGASKWEGERHTQAICRRFFIVRTSWLFGEGHDSFVHHVLKWAETKSELRLVSDKWSIPTYTPDLAAWIHALFERKAEAGVYHVANGGGCNWLEYGKEILADRDMGHIPTASISLEELDLPARRPHYSILNLGKFSKRVGITPRPWEAALKVYFTDVLQDTSTS